MSRRCLPRLPGLETPNLTGGIAKMLPNHHITKPVYIGEVRADGQFDVVWKTTGPVPGDAWSDFLPGSKDIDADWVTLEMRKLQQDNQEVFGTELQMMKPPPEGRAVAVAPCYCSPFGACARSCAQSTDDADFLATLGELREADFPTKKQSSSA